MVHRVPKVRLEIEDLLVVLDCLDNLAVLEKEGYLVRTENLVI
jgi:hypothetical protein